jgi:hypothetical protein
MTPTDPAGILKQQLGIPEEIDPSLQPEIEEPAEDNEEDKQRLNKICKNLVEELTKEEQQFREMKLGVLRRNELMWRGIQRILYDENASMYRSISEYSADELENLEPTESQS